MNVVLIGYRGSGKTTVGRLVAAKLKVSFVDTDEIVAREAGVSIAGIFNTEGEAEFRKRESAVIARVAGTAAGVISVGGGAIENATNTKLLKATGRVAWLTCSAETLHTRIVADESSKATRPRLTAAGGLAEVRAVLTRREPMYRASSDATFDCEGKSAEKIAADVVAWFRASA